MDDRTWDKIFIISRVLFILTLIGVGFMLREFLIEVGKCNDNIVEFVKPDVFCPLVCNRFYNETRNYSTQSFNLSSIIEIP